MAGPGAPGPEAPGPEAPDPGDTPEPEGTVDPSGPGRRSPAGGRRLAGVLIGVLTLLLGFAIVVQVRANSADDSLSGLREEDLVGILDNQNARAERLRSQIAQLQTTLRRLQDSGDRSAAARQQARQEAQALGVLLGTLRATGPGVVVTVTDPRSSLGGEDLLDVVQELRGAGAEAIQFGSADGARVRVTTTTSLSGGGGDVAVDGTPLVAPYTVLAIGDPTTLDTALNIPGGIAAAVRADGGELSVAERRILSVTAVRSLPEPRYAKPDR